MDAAREEQMRAAGIDPDQMGGEDGLGSPEWQKARAMQLALMAESRRN